MVRFYVLATLGVLGALTLLAAVIGGAGWWVLLAIVVALLVLGIHDVTQKKHSILRNYPVLGHMRFLLEEHPARDPAVLHRAQLRRPALRPRHPLVDLRARQGHQRASRPFGTERDVNELGYEYLRALDRAPAEPRRGSRACASAARTAPSRTTWRC